MDSDDEDPPIVKAKRRRKPINKKTKLHLVFNEDARRDFLTGFHKRKLQRKKKAKEELQELLKAEKKRIKLEAKEQYKKLVHSYKPIPELEEQFAKEYDVEDTTVSVLELDTDLLAETNFLIGRNRGQIEDTEIKEEEDEGESDPEEQNEEMPGMSLKDKKPEKKKTETKKEPPKVLKTKKEIKKDLKKQSTKTVKKSRVFQKLNEIHTLKQKKKSSIKRRDARKSQSHEMDPDHDEEEKLLQPTPDDQQQEQMVSELESCSLSNTNPKPPIPRPSAPTIPALITLVVPALLRAVWHTNHWGLQGRQQPYNASQRSQNPPPTSPSIAPQPQETMTITFRGATITFSKPYYPPSPYVITRPG